MNMASGELFTRSLKKLVITQLNHVHKFILTRNILKFFFNFLHKSINGLSGITIKLYFIEKNIQKYKA